MLDNISSKKRIVKNSLMLYVRMFLTILVGLYTSRVVLNTLGVEDYGIYGLVGSVVAIMGFLNSSMSGATSRFIMFELGEGNRDMLNKTFSSALIIHYGIAVLVFILAETFGLWFLSCKLNIPDHRMGAALWVYHLSVLSAMLSITQVPYNSIIIAHEKMEIYAYLEILNVCLKLCIVYLLMIGDFDKLILYAWLTLIVSFLIMMIYRIYCIRRFEECKVHWIWDLDLTKRMLSFSGWNLFAAFSWSLRQQGANFILNYFYGVILNAASGLAATVQSLLMGFSINVITSYKPQIIKTYASGNFREMNKLIRTGTKFSTYLLFLFTIPFIVETEKILTFWLKQLPEGLVFMAKMLLVMNVFSNINSVLQIIIDATGQVKLCSFVNSLLMLVCLPLMYFLLSWGWDYKACYVLFVAISFLNFVIMLFLSRANFVEFELIKYLTESILPSILIFIISLVFTSWISGVLDAGIASFIITSFSSIILMIILSYMIGLTKNEKSVVNSYVKNKLLTIFRVL